MLATRNWLRTYVDRDFSVTEIADGLTKAGIEVESIEVLGERFSGVVVGEITSRTSHPDADKLSVCRVDVGEKEDLTIVCGAPNCDAGIKVPVARVGAVLPGDFRIDKAKLKGIESSGMICSAGELGVSSSLQSEEERTGIWRLPDHLETGVGFKEALGFDDVVFELGLTPNRSDCLGMINVAREVAMIHNLPVQIPQVEHTKDNAQAQSLIQVDIEDPDLSNRYIGRIVRDIKMGPSPVWMQNLLRASGVRPINNIVDVTNYVMLETGQPLHAFDLNKLEGGVIQVRSAREGETFVTLDDVSRVLDPEMIVIADGEKPVALAGVMGGANSEVDAQTVDILLESAHFNPVSVRKTSRKLGLRSEASSRFERGVSPEGSLYAVNRAVDLIVAMEAGQAVPGAVDNYPRPQQTYRIALRPQRVNKVLGTSISPEEMADYFSRLNFDVQMGDHTVLEVSVPPYRMDITGEIDLVEEVARIYGYDNIPTTLPVSSAAVDRKSPVIGLEERIKELLTGMDLTEVITYAFIHPDSFDLLCLSADHPLRETVKLMNPLSEAQSVMRTTLLPGLLETASRNIRRSQRDLKLFETGKVFRPDRDNLLPREIRTLSCLVTGEKRKQWHGELPEPDFFYLKGILETLSEALGTPLVLSADAQADGFHPGRTAGIYHAGARIGTIGELSPLVMEKADLEGRRMVALEMDVEAFIDGYVTVKEYRPLPRYPHVSRDIAFTIDESVSDARIMEAIAAVAGERLVDYWLFDLYQGEQIEQGKKSLAYTLTYQDMERTLTDEEVTRIHDAVRRTIEETFGAKLR